mmetsp:Transcript_21686/g.25045  ORF Transcript_21686/g.25045 Transcript_21686/m.25045 type:complete len:618 (+) Transcript_21686:390-2243(+)
MCQRTRGVCRTSDRHLYFVLFAYGKKDEREVRSIEVPESEDSRDTNETGVSNNQEKVSSFLNPVPSVKELTSKRAKFISPEKTSSGRMKNLFKKEEQKVDLDIGLKLALPDKIGIMRGLEAPNCAFETPSKKLMILPEESPLKKSFLSPFKRAHEKKNRACSEVCENNEDYAKEEEKSEEVNEIILRTSELEPSVHQITIPRATELLIHARVCALLESYDLLMESRAKAGKRWFSFGVLVGLTRTDLQNIYLNAIGKKPNIPLFIGSQNLPPPLPTSQGNPFVTATGIGNPFELNSNDLKSLCSLTISSESTKSHKRNNSISAMKEMKPHPATIKSLLECADDMVVEGYFTETIGHDSELNDGAEISSVQVGIFSSQRQRQFIVCYRGSMLQHAKPLKSKGITKADSSGIISCFSETYFEANLESRVFKQLHSLMSENPFCDVLFTGHSYGGCLAQIAAVRCAEKYPMMTISCHLFGCPKIGEISFRERSHSLPNLRLVRLENNLDPYVALPHGNWSHIGHTIVIQNSKENNAPFRKSTALKMEPPVVAQAFKFGKKGVQQGNALRLKKSQVKSDHSMRNYVHAIEKFTHNGCQWVEKFAGEGDGILAADNEQRLVV